MRSAAWGLVKRVASRRLEKSSTLSTIVAARQYHTTLRLATPLDSANESHLDLDDHRRVTSTHIDSYYKPRSESEVQEHFLDYLNGTPANLHLPRDIGKLDAYLHLRQYGPSYLSRIEDEGLNQLCMQAGMEQIGGVIGKILDDLDGVSDEEDLGFDPDTITQVSQQLQEPSFSKKGGIFAARAGSKRRMNALQNLIIGVSRRRRTSIADELPPTEEVDQINNMDYPLSASTLSRALGMLLEDFRILQQEQGTADSTTNTLIPLDMDVGTARRLTRTISRSKDSNLAPILNELIRYLSRFDMIEGAFPMPLEGCHLLNYFLDLDSSKTVMEGSSSNSTQTASTSATLNLPDSLQGANYILDQMNKSSPDTISNLLISEASEVGQDYKKYLLSQGVSEAVSSQSSLHFTLRYIPLMIMLKRKRFRLVGEQLDRLWEDLKMNGIRFDVALPPHLLVKPVRLCILQAVSTGHGREISYEIASRFADVWTRAESLEAERSESGASDGTGSILKILCEAYVEADDPKLAVRLMMMMVNRRKMGGGEEVGKGDRLAPEAETVGASVLLRILRNQANDGRGDLVAHLLSTLGIVDVEGNITDDKIDNFFPKPLRTSLITIVAKARLNMQSKALYERWGAAMKDKITVNQVNAHIKEVKSREIPKKKPPTSESMLASSEEEKASVIYSQRCLSILARSFTKNHKKPYLPAIYDSDGTPVEEPTPIPDDFEIHPDIQFVYHVLFQFIQGRDRTMMDREDLFALSSTYFSLGQRMAAFKCLSDIARREERPTMEEASMVLRLLATVDLVRTVDLMLDRIDYWAKQDNDTRQGWQKGDPKLSMLYSPLLGSCLRTGQQELAIRLLDSAKVMGIEEDVGIRAIAGLIKFTYSSNLLGVIPDGIDAKVTEGINLKHDRNGSHTLFMARWIQHLIEKENYRPEPHLLGWLIQNSVREGGLVKKSERKVQKAKGEKTYVPFTLKDNPRKAAILLLSLSSKHLHIIDLQTVRVTLACIQNKAFSLSLRGKVTSKVLEAGLSQEIDQVAQILRWTPNIQYNDGFMLQDQVQQQQQQQVSIVFDGGLAREPNRLPPALYCRLVVTYLRVGDILGAASVLTWAREEAGLSLEDLESHWETRTNSFTDYLRAVAFAHGKRKGSEFKAGTTLEYFAGTAKVPRSKIWWQRPSTNPKLTLTE